MMEASPASGPAGRCPWSLAASGGRRRRRLRRASWLLPPSWTFRWHTPSFGESLVEFHTGEYRLCVIDACSAAEIALGAALTVHLRAHGLADAEIEQLLRLGSGIAEAFPVYRQFVPAAQSAVSRNRVIDQLANPRNRAVHAGERPPEAVAKRALETAARLVGEAVPLPRPDDIPRLARAMARVRRAPRPAAAGPPSSQPPAAPGSTSV